MTVAETIHAKLAKALAPEKLDVEDQSALHEGHSGARPEGETHFHVTVVSAAFAGKSRLERQRLVFGALQAEMAGPVHALGVTAKAPGETG
ncbi:MAG: BolA family transcriptional regulator [Alphaproteobacteria bacterium]|jgi:BolA family transcriptional regulator, general stress-responsive regulator|nr:BolA family transcriptional regulator [Alphaproteobacteria bacterium]